MFGWISSDVRIKLLNLDYSAQDSGLREDDIPLWKCLLLIHLILGKRERKGNTLLSLSTRLYNFLLWSIDAFFYYFIQPLETPVKQVLLPFHRQGNWGPEQWSDLCKVSRIQICICLTSKPVLYPWWQNSLHFSHLSTIKILPHVPLLYFLVKVCF